MDASMCIEVCMEGGRRRVQLMVRGKTDSHPLVCSIPLPQDNGEVHCIDPSLTLVWLSCVCVCAYVQSM